MTFFEIKSLISHADLSCFIENTKQLWIRLKQVVPADFVGQRLLIRTLAYNRDGSVQYEAQAIPYEWKKDYDHLLRFLINDTALRLLMRETACRVLVKVVGSLASFSNRTGERTKSYGYVEIIQIDYSPLPAGLRTMQALYDLGKEMRANPHLGAHSGAIVRTTD